MKIDEFVQEVGSLITSLWPRYTPTQAETDVWFERLKLFSVEECKRAVGDAYAESKFQTPRLADVLEKLRGIRKVNAGGYAGEKEENHHDDLPGMRKDITDFLTPQQVQEWRDAIIANEPSTQIFEKYPNTHAHWVTLIHARAIRNEVTYPVTVNGVRQWRTASVKDAWGIESERRQRPAAVEKGSIGEAAQEFMEAT